MGVNTVSNAGASTQVESARSDSNTPDDTVPSEAVKEEVTKFVKSASTDRSNQKMEVLSVFSRHMDKLPEEFTLDDLNKMSKDKSLPQELRDACAALKKDPGLFGQLDDPSKHIGEQGKFQTDGKVSLTGLRNEMDQKRFTDYTSKEAKDKPVEVDLKMEVLSVFSRNWDKLPEEFSFDQLDELSKDESLPQELRDAYAALKKDPGLFGQLDDPSRHIGEQGKFQTDGKVSLTGLRNEMDQGRFVDYSRMKSELYTQYYTPSDAAPGEAPREMNASDAYRELYLYSESLPDNIDKASLQAIVDGKCTEKCPVQLQAAAQYMLDNPDEMANLAPGGSVSNGEMQNIAVDKIQFTKQELSAVETLDKNQDLFFSDGDLSRERLAEMAKDESLSPEVREAAKTLGESDVVYGMLDNAKNGHVASDGRGLLGRGAVITNDNKVVEDDVNSFLDDLTTTNQTARPVAKPEVDNAKPPAGDPKKGDGGAKTGDGGAKTGTGGAGSDDAAPAEVSAEMQAVLSQNMLAGSLDDPNVKEKRGGERLKRFLEGLGGVLDKVKQGLDYLSAIPGVGAIFAGASTVVSAIDKFAVEAPQAIMEGKSRKQAFKDAAKDFGKESAMNVLAVVPGGGAVRAGATVAKTVARETVEGVVRGGVSTVKSQVDNVGATLATKATDRVTGAVQGQVDNATGTLTTKASDAAQSQVDDAIGTAQSQVDDAMGTAQAYTDDAVGTAQAQVDDAATGAVQGKVDEVAEGGLNSSDEVGEAAGRESTEATGKNASKSADDAKKSADDAKKSKDADSKKSKDRDDDKKTKDDDKKKKKEKEEREQQYQEQTPVTEGAFFVPLIIPPLMPLEQLKDKKKKKEEPVEDNVDAAQNR